jgi:hypothetical protein
MIARSSAWMLLTSRFRASSIKHGGGYDVDGRKNCKNTSSFQSIRSMRRMNGGS